MGQSEEKILKSINFKVLIWLMPTIGIIISVIIRLGDEGFYLLQPYMHLVYGILVTSGLWVGCMLIVVYLWKKYPWQQFPVKHLVIEFVLITAYTLGFSFGLYKLFSSFGLIPPVTENMVMEIFTVLLITYFITTLHESVFFYRQWKYNFSKSVQLENQHLKAKYESLKTQMNPHYVFNSLNNLVSIVDENPLAVEYINQMSSFLRYMLQGRREELVCLEEELNMLNKYFYLHKIRLGKILTVIIDVPEEFNTYKLPPLTLQMLAENCIKHNVIAKSKPLYISVKANGKSIVIKNNLNPQKHVDSTKQGIINIKERYKYFTNNDIMVEQTNEYFKVSVPLIS